MRRIFGTCRHGSIRFTFKVYTYFLVDGFSASVTARSEEEARERLMHEYWGVSEMVLTGKEAL